MKKVLIRLTGLLVTTAIAISGNGLVLATEVEGTGNETGTATEATAEEPKVEETSAAEETEAPAETPAEDSKSEETAAPDATPADTEDKEAPSQEEKSSEEETAASAESETTIDSVQTVEVKVPASKASSNEPKSTYDYGVIFSSYNTDSKLVFNYLREQMPLIANGTVSSTRISVPTSVLTENYSYRISSIGLGSSNFVNTDEEKEANIQETLYDTVQRRVEYSYVVTTLMNACPYDMYWYNGSYESNSTYCSVSFGYSYNSSTKTITVSSIIFSFEVSKDYRGANEYTVNASKVAKAITAYNNAKAIIEKYKNADDYNKLLGYKNEICKLVSFDNAAFGIFNRDDMYGNSWQMINVFDSDPNTDVISDGYARAFQFLCDNTTFSSSRIYALSVFGQLDGESPHVWNIIHMEDNKNYLVDLTNCDGIGYADFFMKGVTYSAANSFSIPQFSTPYSYSWDLLTRFPSADLSLSNTDYIGESQLTPAKVNATSIALNDLIGINFKLNLPEEFLSDSGAKIKINDIDYQYGSIDSNGRYIVTCSVPVVEIEKELVLKLYRGNGTLYPLLDKKGSEVTTDGFTYSVSEYIREANAASSGVSAETIKVLKRLSDFSKKSRLYFNPNENVGSYSDIAGDIDKVTAANFSTFAFTETLAANAGIKRSGSSLALETATEINHKFELDSGKSIYDYKFYVNNQLVTTSSSGNYLLWYNSSSKKYVLTIKGIAASHLQDVYQVVIKDSNDREIYRLNNYSAFSYANAVFAKAAAEPAYASSKASLLALLKAMYLYNQDAIARFKT
jgi:hypothetical protein